MRSHAVYDAKRKTLSPEKGTKPPRPTCEANLLLPTLCDHVVDRLAIVVHEAARLTLPDRRTYHVALQAEGGEKERCASINGDQARILGPKQIERKLITSLHERVARLAAGVRDLPIKGMRRSAMIVQTVMTYTRESQAWQVHHGLQHGHDRLLRTCEGS